MIVTADSRVPQDVVDYIVATDGFVAGRTVSRERPVRAGAARHEQRRVASCPAARRRHAGLSGLRSAPSSRRVHHSRRRTHCGFCLYSATVRDFLSLAEPTRPARVEVRVVQPGRL